MSIAVHILADANDDSVVIRAIHNGRRVGILCGRFYPQGLVHLEEVEITDALPLEQTWLDFLLRRTRTRCYQGQGIGTRLLTEFLSICRSRDVSQVIGAVVQHDLNATPGLLDWYARYGFQRRVPSESPLSERYRPPNTVWEVVLKLHLPASNLASTSF
jgi:GNAT superfamily N-acetyltransferase